MRLSALLSDLGVGFPAVGDLDVEVGGLAVDSRQVKPGDAFVALAGKDSDGHGYVAQALAKGAVALVLEREVEEARGPRAIVPSTRRALALMAAAWHGRPGRRLRVVGITGTDGKTTTSTLVHAVLDAAGHPTGLLTTVAARIGDQLLDTGLHTTTPDPLDFHHYLATMADAGMRYAVIETTSHGLDQDRTLGAEYDVAVVTNITREHLDYHGTYEAYRDAKAKLFRALKTTYRKPDVPKVAILNADDTSYDYLRQFPGDVNLTYGIEGVADVRPATLDVSAAGIRMHVTTPAGEVALHSPLLGRYNAYNILAAVAVGVSQGASAEAIASGVRSVSGIVGRMDRIEEGQDFVAVVDFAHTPNALERMLELAREMTTGRVIVTFGCAGLRDREKRPVMGDVASRLADLVVITSEDPRTEDPRAIMAAVAAGCERAGGREGETFWRVEDRGEAIRFAVQLARPDDLVVAAGKGHEKSLCIGTIEYPWSDHESMRQAIRERLAAG